MEAGDSVSPCFSAAGTSRHDLHEVITSVAMIRSHQGLRSYGQRRRGGGELKETLDLFPISLFLLTFLYFQ